MKSMNRRDFLSMVGAGAVMSFLPGGCRSKQNKPKYTGPVRHVIVISLDTTRKDHFGCYGNNWIQTPRIDALADESILFTDYMTVVPTTLASHTSLLTGKYPHTHGTPRNGFMVNQENVMLAKLLKKAGFHTVGIPGSFAIESRFGFSQGFDHYDENFDTLVGQRGALQNERPAKSVTDTTIRYIEKNGIPHNLFLFAHYFDPHAPFTPPEPYNKMYINNKLKENWLIETQGQKNTLSNKSMASLYAGEISYMDKHVGRLIDYLRRRGILEDSILIITSDHGENFWDHPTFWDHGQTVYQSTMSAVCVIRLPKGQKACTKVKQLLASIDIFPTLLQYLGLEIPEGIDGQSIELADTSISFTPRIFFGQATKPRKKVETDPHWYNIRKARCIREANLKYIQTPYKNTEELYDISGDPYEFNNLLENPSPEMSAKATELKVKLEVWAQSANPLASRFEPSQRDETIQRLKSLGYLK